MENGVFPALEFHIHWLHEPLAPLLAIAGIYVNMLAPDALRAVIGIAASAHKETAPFAGEVFFGALEFPRGRHFVVKINTPIHFIAWVGEKIKKNYFCVEMVRESWNQLEKYIFETSALIGGTRQLNNRLEITQCYTHSDS